MPKQNTLAEELTSTALRQLSQSYSFKMPRITQIRKFRALYNNQVQRLNRVRYNAPIPIFAGMIDTLAADLDDSIILKYEETDAADWKAAEKANAWLHEEMESQRPGAKWDAKFRMARQECIFTGRGFLKFTASNEDGFETNLSSVPYEDMFWEPKGRNGLENHLYRGQINHWRTKKDIEDDSTYNKAQVKKLLEMGGSEYKPSSTWENFDYANRFLPLGLSAESSNYVGELMFNLVEWELMYRGQYWSLVFEPITATWLRCEKLTDVNSSGLSNWMSFASHEDAKNFASKGFADDLYPLAVMMTDMLNEDAENIRRRNSGARAYDKDMFPDVAKLDEAQMGRDRLVPVDTKGGARKIQDGIYHFETPDISGTIEVLNYLEQLIGRNNGISDTQQGDQAGAEGKAVGVTYAELGAASKRLSYTSRPIIEVGQELGMRGFGALKDYMKEPLSIKLLGEEGYEWTYLKRTDLNIKRDFKMSVSSKNQEDQINQMASTNKMNALNSILQPVDPNFKGNIRTVNEHRLRQGGWSEAEIALILDANTQADKRTLAETSEAIQILMTGKIPPINYNANAFFMQKIVDFVKTHQEDPKVKRNMQKFAQYVQLLQPIAADNEQRRAQSDIQAVQRQQMLAQAGQPTQPGIPPQGPSQPPQTPNQNQPPQPPLPQPTQPSMSGIPGQ